MMFLGGPGTRCGIDGLDVFSFGHGALVTAQTSLGKLVHALVGGRPSGLDHVENTTFVRTQSGDFPDNAADHLRVFA